MAIQDKPQYKETRELVDELARIYAREDLPYALGAQFALETQADNMLIQLGTGFSVFERWNQLRLKKNFFEVHREEEPEHFAAMRKCIEFYEFQDEKMVRDGSMRCLELLANFWIRLEREL